ncbi:non-hydrolyzing UDP-N-acetylglucosamine 2-epimerase [Sulfitobacter geojensis]|uniref:UDP-N-acetylglucosamine 2-epimerase (Non-hydrolyzing) n=1 Tax=Sulfitobacter geojensis TaxID=1342299 RepID=A0AAE2VXH6_9RHOB|nr:UDP-N-acetylglucosamine 2-epimerase (non-hydrolyzing) [Sulfitobacter geojensis]MBM1689170.1 UDP-N-acetylglucosamine 2-epimerase (non-hydrolyzing) [Sulfitobacter geojensis]MBM1693237.1 UDP-N-acetylglucosamine 2-epimerase (non-hydrolyzing) [Sulfitobacter geojensis]MBM1705403.1 UDP-N-acetylglucosamine 2-epimerase (non-hydrolyzing) [Sulfitobacter geojensis]MBM1709461.1 UDP-N-acetylglucosamine 2-epimerase (non-hydrolyzing) [Sulfitobacter geojensis]MBM1713526.1 UDP-N-acetylglucosamine 2-epimerase
MSALKVVTILGTRPEIIRLSRVMERLDRYCDHVIVHTGQNWDYELNEVFFEDLGVRKPNHFLGVGGGSLGETLGGILIQTERVLLDERPDAVLVLGDTNSAISSIMARRLKIPVYHMEAGNRSFDRNVPEETNRRLVDHIADFNLVYTEHARRHLLAEGLEHRRINLTGSPMREVLEHYRDRIEASDVLERLGLSNRAYFIASLHREENVDHPKRLATLVGALNALVAAHDMPLILSTHPRTRKRLDALGLTFDARVQEMKPFGFHDYNRLQMKAFCAISDSGTIAEEASILGFPAITPRDAIERPEGLDVGCIVMTGVNHEAIFDGVLASTKFFAERKANGLPHPVPEDYCITNTSERVVSLILGTARMSNQWDGIRLNN